MSEEKLNIQPKAGILEVFSRLPYKPENAIAEFVDNSTASYLGHKKILNDLGINKVKIYIEYDQYENVLKITDDAYGMDLADFKRAVLMDQKPDYLNGRNEFGMGLKTAASWFGNVWSVKSTRLGSKDEYSATIDIPKLNKEELNDITIYTKSTSESLHGTTITISNLTKKISAANKSKVKVLLSSIYRRDLSTNEIEIYFDGQKLEPEEFRPLEYKGETWKKNLDFSFMFDDKMYRVTGFVGILAKGSFSKAGFALFRHDRIILGGLGQNYKPKQIFMQAQSQISLKLFGELNMEDFPVNQEKEGFIWDDGLEETFVTKLKKEISEYIKISEMSIKDRIQDEEISQASSNLIEDKVSSQFKGLILDDKPLNTSEASPIELPKFSKDVELYAQRQFERNNFPARKESETRTYSIQLSKVTTKEFKVKWQIANDDQWVSYDPKNCLIIINLNHSFFKPYTNEPEFRKVLETFVIALISAEELAQQASSDQFADQKLILPSVFHNKMNFILKKLSENKKD